MKLKLNQKTEKNIYRLIAVGIAVLVCVSAVKSWNEYNDPVNVSARHTENFERRTNALVSFESSVDYNCTSNNGVRYRLFDYNDRFMYVRSDITPTRDDYKFSETLRGIESDNMYNARISESGNSGAGRMSEQMYKHDSITFMCRRA
ncbi:MULTISPECIES: hypothetical protein [Enterobacter cloacae complex]|uniref:hypothetical protein n=1 Tax=Enterobacter cloacae complex TaxID=354276 RepID=UPI00210A7004|nr:hypothetical protein [Enterobacter kobei]MCQ4375111.1 hypothetical protein [Enterobacter kobei]HDC4672329.1 hypothetical protein [Enterobacter kobei]